MRTISMALAAASLAFAGAASAATIQDTLGEFNFDGGPNFPEVEQVVGTYMFDLMGDDPISASIAGTFGNSQNPSSAPFELYADGEFIGECIQGDPCFFGPETPFDFTVSNLANLLDGELVLSVIQTGESIIRLGETTLTIETTPSAVPLPASGVLLLGAMGAAAAMRRKQKS